MDHSQAGFRGVGGPAAHLPRHHGLRPEAPCSCEAVRGGAGPDFWLWWLVAGVARQTGATSGCLVDAGSLRFLREVRGSRVVRRSCPGVARVGRPVAQMMNE